MLIEIEVQKFPHATLTALEAAISECFEVEMDQAANLRLEAERHAETYANRRRMKTLVEWLNAIPKSFLHDCIARNNQPKE